MSNDIKFRWGDLQSRILNLTEPTDWAVLPNNKERRIFELVTTVLRRFPMQREWPPEHHDLKPDDWRDVQRGLGLMLMTDVEFEKLVREFKIQDNIMARALSRYLGLKSEVEHDANRTWLLNEEAVRRWKLKKKTRLEREQILERLSELDERDRMDNRYLNEIKHQEKILAMREQDYAEDRAIANERQKLINKRMREASLALIEHTIEMIQHDQAFREETRHSHLDKYKKELEQYWQKMREMQQRNEWLLKTMPERENQDKLRLATKEWRAETREKEADEAFNWLHEDRLKTYAEQKHMRRLIAAEAIEDQIRREILANRSTAQMTAMLDAMDESTRISAPSESSLLNQSTGRAAYTRNSKG